MQSKENNEDFELLVETIGKKLAMKVVEIFGGSSIYIPKNILTTKRHLEILEDYKSGKTYRELSVKFHYSESHIRNIVNKK